MRPPLKTAEQKAIDRLIAAHTVEFNDMVDEELARLGWRQEIVERQVWTKASATGIGPSTPGS